MKKVLVICGTGVATSTVALNKLQEWATANNYNDKVTFSQTKVADAMSKIDDYDIIVSTTIVPDSISHKVINGLCLITGINVNAFFEQVKQRIDE